MVCECQTFIEGQALSYLFGKCVCLIFQETIATKKVAHIKRNYETNHNNYNNFTGKAREDEAAPPRKYLTKQSSFFTRKFEENDRNTHGSYEVTKLITERMKPFSDGEFFKECML